MSAAVTLERLTKRYAKAAAPVLSELDLAIEGGELFTLIGPSGCGKSTTLNLVAGFEAPTSGLIRVGGEIVNDRSPSERDLAMVFQSYALYPHMDVRRNLAFPLEVAGVARDEIATRVREAADRLGIADLLDRRPAALSGGQRQRVALGRALVRRPRVCLLDEPLSNLDVSLRAQMRAEIKRLHRELGATFVYVTHDQTEAMTLSDRIAVLHLGRLQQVGSPRAIYDRPENTFVASFVGSPSINLIEAERLPAALREHVGDAHLVGIRPEDVTVGRDDAPDHAITGRVDVIEPTGPETWVTVEALGARITGRAAAAASLGHGGEAWVTLPPARMHLFDAEGRRIARAGAP